MTREEKMLVERIDVLEREKVEAIRQFDQQIAELMIESTQATLIANDGRRRLITAQGDELVDEVASAFEAFGFGVEQVDDALTSGMPKREDLRLRDPADPNSDWEAIVEVRGYGKSGGTTADIQRIGRFANFYLGEKGRLPDKRMYVVNGQIELPPSQRELPLASAREDVELFGEDNGVVISTLDLFRVLETSTPKQLQAVRESIKRTSGRWTGQAITFS